MIASLIIIALSTILLLPLLSKIFKKTIFFTWSVSFVLGISVWTFVFFLANRAGLFYDLKNAFLVYFTVLLVTYITSFFLGENTSKKSSIRLIVQKISKIFNKNRYVWIVLSIIVAFSLAINLYWPVKDWDSLVLYDFRAKIFVEKGAFTEVLHQTYYTSYPLMTSLSHTLVYLINPQASPMLIYFAFYVSFIIIFYFTLIKLEVTKRAALLSAVAFAGTGVIFDQSVTAYTNLPYALFLFAGYAFAALWYKKEKDSLLVLSAIFVGLTGWIRFAEPFWLVVLAVVALMLIAKRKYIFLPPYLLLVYGLRIPWKLFSAGVSGVPSGVGASLSKSVPLATGGLSIGHIGSVTGYLFTNIFSEYGVLILIYLLLLYYVFVFLKKKIKAQHVFDLLFTLGLVAAISLGTFLFSLYQETWLDIGDSARRMSMILVPVLLFSSVRLFENYCKS